MKDFLPREKGQTFRYQLRRFIREKDGKNGEAIEDRVG